MQIKLSKAYQRAPSTKASKPGFSFVLDQTNYGSNLMPNNFFWKYLIRRQRKSLPILIPDTIVSAEAQFNPIWIYSKDGYLFSTEKFTHKEVANKFCSNAYPDQLVAVVKKPDFYTNGTRNELHLCSCKNVLSSYNNSQRATDNCVFQRFVKGSGTRAFLCRTVLRTNGLSEGWTLSNKNQFYKQSKKSKESQNIVINTQEPSTLNVVHFTSGGPFRETVKTLQTILRYVNQYHKLSLVQLAGDFIKDQSGVWWLVGIKYFRSSHSPESLIALADQKQRRSVSVKKVIQYKVTKMCAYCEKSCLEQHLAHKMTTKMIIETDKFLEHRGKKFDWLYRSDVPNLEFQSLYEQKTVCQRCYLLYKYIKELLDLQLKFANQVGIPITESSKESIFDLSHFNTNAVCKERSLVTLKAGDMPAKIELGSSQINIDRNIPIKNDKIENKMFRYRVLLFFNLIKEVVDVESHRNYFLEFNMFGQRVRYKLDVQPGQTQISINRFRLFYLFAPNPRALTDYFTQLKYLRLLIFRDDGKKTKEVFATLDLQISDFSSDKVQLREIYKMFNLKNSKWGWGLSASIGIVGSGQTVVRNLLLKPFKCIYLPPNDYFTCEPLPIEWETFLEQAYSQIPSMQFIQNPDILQPIVQSVMTKHASLFWGHELPKIQEQTQFNTRISKSLHKIRRKVQFNV